MIHDTSITRASREKAAEVVVRVIRSLDEGLWFGERDYVGHGVNVHQDDGEYTLTVNWETRAWCDYGVIDQIDAALVEAGFVHDVDLLSSYEVGVKLYAEFFYAGEA